MPLYEYRCKSCGEKEEKLEGFEAPTEHDCAKCGTPKGMNRQISLNSFTLAGGGWHAQGYMGGTPGKHASAPATPSPVGGCAGGCACHPVKSGN